MQLYGNWIQAFCRLTLNTDVNSIYYMKHRKGKDTDSDSVYILFT